MQSEISQCYQKANNLQFYLYLAPRVVIFVETESQTVVASGWAEEGRRYFIGIVSVLQDEVNFRDWLQNSVSALNANEHSKMAQMWGTWVLKMMKESAFLLEEQETPPPRPKDESQSDPGSSRLLSQVSDETPKPQTLRWGLSTMLWFKVNIHRYGEQRCTGVRVREDFQVI